MAKPTPDPSLPWPIVKAGVLLIADAESLRLRAYRCPAGVWTIGWGETSGVRPGSQCTQAAADRWLCDDLTDRAQDIEALLTEPANDNQLAALVSFAYNVGLDGLRGSTVLRCHNKGDFEGAARAFSLWNKARNPRTKQLEVLAGLSARRAAEAALYLQPTHDMVTDPMPQAVAPESKMAASPINRNGATVVASGAAWIASQVDTLQPLVDKGKHLLVDTLGVQPKTLLVMVGVLVVYAGARVIYTRFQQRSEGWA